MRASEAATGSIFCIQADAPTRLLDIHRLPKAVEMLEQAAAESKQSEPYTPPTTRERVLERNRSSTDHFVERLIKSRKNRW